MSHDLELGVKEKEDNAISTTKSTTATKRKTFRKMVASLIPYTDTKSQKESDKEALKNISNLPDIFASLGFHEIYMTTMYRALLIEYIGTAAFVYFHIAIVSAGLNFTYPPLLIGIAHAFLLTLFIYQFAMSSGAHFNSLITMSSMVTGHIPFVRGVLYIGVQIFGAVSGAAIMYESVTDSTAELNHLGGCSMGALKPKQALAIEFFFCLAMLFPVYGMAFNLRQREIFGPVLPPIFIGFMLGLIIFSSASLAPPPFTGAGFNPSMCLGTAWAYSRTELSGHDSALDHHWVYWVGPILASLVNGALYTTAPPFYYDMPEFLSDKKQDDNVSERNATGEEEDDEMNTHLKQRSVCD